MATPAQTSANRLNALKSTGPRTPTGKALASQNSLKHGLLAKQHVIEGESQAEYDLHTDQILHELSPVSPMESILADRIISLSWRLKRTVRIQNQAIDALLHPNTSSRLAGLVPRTLLDRLNNAPHPQNDHLALGRASITDLSNARVLERLLMYERRIEHSLYKTIQQLHQLSIIRNIQLLQEQ
jgi:hypothetical protein